MRNSIFHRFTAFLARCFTRPKISTEEIGWTANDQKLAEKQGWGIYPSQWRGATPFQLQAKEYDSCFKNDPDVWVFVFLTSHFSNKVAAKAINFLREHSPYEYESIIHFASQNFHPQDLRLSGMA